MEPHGELKLEWSGNILYVKPQGPFNDEGAQKAAREYFELIGNKTCNEFAVIEVLTEDSVGSPQTMDEVAKVWRFIGENGCMALALVYCNEVQRCLAEDFLPEFGRLFSSVEDAEAWVRACGYGDQ